VANALLTIDQITNEALRVLVNKFGFVNKVNRQYDPSFAKSGAKIGSTLRIRKPVRYLVSDGPNLVVQDTQEDWTTLTCNTQKHVGMGFTTAEMALNLDEFSKRIINPAMSQLAAIIDADVASAYRWIGNSVGAPGTTPATAQVLLAAQQLLDENACPRDSRYAVINPAANAALVNGLSGFFNPQNTISKQFNSGNMGTNVLGLDLSMSQSIGNFVTGTRNAAGTTGAAVTLNGQTTITLAGMGANATIPQGEVFTVATVFAVNPQTRQSTGSLFQFVVLAPALADGAGAATVTVAPIYDATDARATVNILPPTGQVVTFRGAASTGYPQNMIMHPDAITFATADLELPDGTDMASRAQYEGVSLRIIRDYAIESDRLLTRVDVLYGYSVIRDQLAVRLWG